MIGTLWFLLALIIIVTGEVVIKRFFKTAN